MATIIFTVNNQLVYDQRMQRICSSLQQHGFTVLLIGRNYKGATALHQQIFTQKRLYCFFTKGFLLYALFNIQLFFYLLFTKATAICAIDLDTVVPCYFVAKFKKIPIVYDAHEWFTQQKEVVTRPFVYKFWLAIERFFVPRIKNGYTVNGFIQQTFFNVYGVQYGIIRNLPTVHNSMLVVEKFTTPTIIYQGAVNEGRSFETLIPAMQHVNAHLLIIGNGNFMQQAKQITATYALEHKVFFKGNIIPAELAATTPKAHIGITLFELTGKNQEYSLANRFFDYMMAGIPQLCVNYPEYEFINKKYGFAYLINDVNEKTIAQALNNLLSDGVLYTTLTERAKLAQTQLNWQEEQKHLINYWNKILN